MLYAHALEEILQILDRDDAVYKIDGKPVSAAQKLEALALHQAAHAVFIESASSSDELLEADSVLWTVTLHRLESFSRKAYA